MRVHIGGLSAAEGWSAGLSVGHGVGVGATGWRKLKGAGTGSGASE